MSMSELKTDWYKFNNSTTATANNLQFSAIERREVRTSYSSIHSEHSQFSTQISQPIYIRFRRQIHEHLMTSSDFI